MFPSRRGAPSVVSLPVGRHYPGASRKFIVHGEGTGIKSTSHGVTRFARTHARTQAHTGGADSRCMRTEFRRVERRRRAKGDRVNKLPFCGLPGVFFLLIGMRTGIRQAE